ncbi:MAG TPA: phospholipase D-like domain-containing protein [Bryobacteraceae bacterium]|nr:phospholipase D-like domain-containing protein [Bryobacteraceae bacterium]
MPPDLGDLFSRMRKANDAILFAVFLPSRAGANSIVSEALTLGQKDAHLLVYGTVSDPTAMPNYVAPAKKSADDDDEEDSDSAPKKPQPAVYDRGNVHVVRAAALGKADLIGQFEAELLKVGNAIIHDKIVVVDPLADTGFVALGSHNLGFKASYENDENLLIIRNNPGLVQAYAVHIIDLYEHYRFRAIQQERRRNDAKTEWDGFLSRDSAWLERWVATEKGTIAQYLSS